MRNCPQLIFTLLGVVACQRPATPPATLTFCEGVKEEAPAALTREDLDAFAREYVHLVLGLGVHDADFVDAYYGPPELKAAAEHDAYPLRSLGDRAEQLRNLMARKTAPEASREAQRRKYLDRQLASLLARVRILSGEKLGFDVESKALYDAVSPDLSDTWFEERLVELAELVPGKGALSERVEAFRKRFEIPKDRLDAVFRAAIAACRERTLAHLSMPAEESFTIEYVTDKPWGGYNWYKGKYQSLIQVNTSLPIQIDRALDIACHEGYPGHHVYNALLERELVAEQGYVEFTVYPLFSAQSLIAEGSANYGVELAFPGDTRAAWEKEHLFPLAGLESDQADTYYRVFKLVKQLSYAVNVAARRYLDGELRRDEAVLFIERYALANRERAETHLKFIDRYRSYVINYNVGLDLVRKHVEALAGSDETRRWQVFGELVSSPRLPSDLVQAATP